MQGHPCLICGIVCSAVMKALWRDNITLVTAKENACTDHSRLGHLLQAERVAREMSLESFCCARDSPPLLGRWGNRLTDGCS